MSSSSPSPSDMAPRRPPTISSKQAGKSPNEFLEATDVPMRGWPDATLWTDSGILLSLGTDPQLLARFRRHAGRRVQVPRTIQWEIRRISENRAQNSEAEWRAANTVVRECFLGSSVFPDPELNWQPNREQYQLIEDLLIILKNEPGGRDKSHRGEATLIALAVDAMKTHPRAILLTNDGGASRAAGRYGLRSRHIGHLMAELGCADPSLSPEECLELFTTGRAVSSPPYGSCPKKAGDFACAKDGETCARCDVVGE